MKGFKVFTHDLRPPVRGGDPVWDGKLPFNLSPVEVDESDDGCGAGWNFVENIKSGLLIAGLWPNGRPSRVFEVAVSENGRVIHRGNKYRTDRLEIVSEVGEGPINDAIAEFSKKAFGAYADEMTQSQIAWREALGRPRMDEDKIQECLREALDVRGLKDWKLKRFEDASAARDAWDAWAARAAWDAWAAWAARAAWDARAANVLLFTAHSKWVTVSPELLTSGIRDAYLNGLEIVIPTGEKELGWPVKP